MNRHDIQNQAGYSLVELLIGVTLIGLVLSLAWGVYSFGVTFYKRGNDQAMLQQEARLVTSYLTKELTYSFVVEIYKDLASLPAGQPTTADWLLYSNTQGIWRQEGVQAPVLVFPSSQISYDLSFVSNDSSESLLSINSVVTLGEEPLLSRTVSKSLHLFNAHLQAAEGSVLLYRKSL